MLTVSLLLAIVPTALPQDTSADDTAPKPVTAETAGIAARVIGLEMTDEELALMVDSVTRNLRSFERMREIDLDNGVQPALALYPGLLCPADFQIETEFVPQDYTWTNTISVRERPANLEDLAFADLTTLGWLIREREVTCVELTEMFLARLKRLDETLFCVINFTEERALAQAKVLDAELAAGKYRGPLHGIPWGAKDLLAVAGYPTTWGAKPFEDQVIDYDAAVVEKLDAAGAILIAKLSLGALAMGDVWYGARTRNPWKPSQGSSGSSAGPASAVAAGAMPFAIGSETLGSIVSPSVRCGCSSLRPTFGRVSRYGAMTLSWSLDKLGPLCRSAADAALVFEAIRGFDERDFSSIEAEFHMDDEVKGMRVGIPRGAFRDEDPRVSVLDELGELGVEFVDVDLPEYPTRAMMILLNAEAATAFDELTRSGRDDLLVRQAEQAWPNSFRTARLIPAVEYLRAQRLRTLLMQDMREVMKEVDVLVHPSFAGDILSLTNLTGHPTFVAPCGFRDDGTPFSISFTGKLLGDDRLLALAHAWQKSTDYHLRHPK